jgi:hypothetical protein
MSQQGWTNPEKEIARNLYAKVVLEEYDEIIKDFKRRAQKVKTRDEFWEMENYIKEVHRDLEARFDPRYSQILFVFGSLLRRGKISNEQLKGLSNEKINEIHRIAKLSYKE